MSPNLSASLSNLASDKRYELLINSINDYAIYMLDPNGYIASWNSGAQRFKGYSEEEVIGKHFSLFFDAENLSRNLPQTILEQARKDSRFEGEGWRVRKDGTRFWAHVVVDAIYDDDKNLLGFAKITRDITERKAAQDALFASEERFRYLVQGVTDYAIYMLTPEGIVSNWNLGAQRIKGYSAEDIVGKHFSLFLTPEDVEAGLPDKALQTAKLEGRYEQEGWRVRKDGSQFRANVIIDAIHNDDQQLIGFAKITRDITEKYKAEEALAKANAALFQSQKMESIGKLTGGIAHDFNNLLTVVSTGLEVLALSPIDARQLKMVDSMKRAVSRGAKLTQQLLSFARQQPLKKETHNLNKLITSFEPVLIKAGKPSIDFQIDLARNISFVCVDSTGFESALLNLIVNASDAMPNGGALKISTNEVNLKNHEVGSLSKGTYIRVCVSDTGSGISADILPLILEPFYTTKEIGKGTGLGLSQVYGFITQSKGDISIESELGKGTAISLYFPTIENSIVAENNTSQTDKKVLLVDDEPDVLDTATALFESMGYEVLTSKSAGDAFDQLVHNPDISILFTDVLMPGGMNGIQLAQKVQSLNPDIKIILASGYPLPALEEDNSLEEFNFLQKPYRLADIEKCLRSAEVA